MFADDSDGTIRILHDRATLGCAIASPRYSVASFEFSHVHSFQIELRRGYPAPPWLVMRLLFRHRQSRQGGRTIHWRCNRLVILPRFRHYPKQERMNRQDSRLYHANAIRPRL